jgi:hypothetical protein
MGNAFMNRPHDRLLLLMVLVSLQGLCGCIFGGGCPLDHSELSAMDPEVACLKVEGRRGSGQCVNASLSITNNCADTLTFADGATEDLGRLVFSPGESGVYDAKSSMQVSPNHWETVATLGSQTIKFTIKTYPR